MRKTLLRTTLAAAAMAAAATPAVAQESQGKWQVKLLATGVLPDGEIDQVNLDLVGLPGNTQTRANDNYVPTAAIEYFFTPSVSLETICCLTQHDVDGTTGIPGAELVSNAKLVPVLFDRLDQDPAVASSVFVTMITDSMGFFAFLGLAVASGLVG